MKIHNVYLVLSLTTLWSTYMDEFKHCLYAFVYAHTQYLEQKVTMHSEHLFCFEFTMSFAHEEHSYLLQM